jgi:tetratricopeptide (TPR) repeat protein
LVAGASLRGYGFDAVEIAVGPLTQAESLKLFRFIHGKRLDPIVEQLASDAGGHPFFLTELARANQAEILNGAKFSLDGLIGIRVAGLTPDSRRLLELVAVSGRPLRDLDAYAAMGGDDPRRHVAHLESVRLLRGVGGGGRLQWETYHDRVRDTVIAGLDDETRIQHHAKLAKVLKESRSAEPEQLAIHFEESLEPTKAGSYYLQAGDQATRSVAFEQASQFYSKALELLESSEVQKLNIREKLADALANAGRSSEAGPIYLAAAEEQKGVQQLELQRRAMDVTLHAGRNQEGMRLLAGLFETLGESLPDGREKAMEWMMSEYGQLMERGPDFIEKPEASVSPEVLWKLDLLYAAGWRMYTCDAILGSYYFCRAARLALDIGETYRASRALASAATIFCWGGDTQARNIGRDWFRKAEEVARREPNEYWLAYLAMKKGFLYWGDGNWQKATEECQKAENHASRSENSFAAFQMDMQKIAIHARMMMGHWRDGLRRTSMFLDLAKRQENMYHQCSMLMTHSLQSLVKDQPDEAERLVLQGRKMWLQVKGIHPGHQKVCSLIDVYLYTGRGLDAEKLIRAELAEMKQVTSYEFIEVWLLTVSHTHGRALIAGAGQLAVSGRQTTRRSQLIEEAQGVAELIEDRRMAWADPLAKLLRAGIANLVGDSTTAEELLTKAESEFRTAGMLMYAAASQFHRGRITRAKVGEELIQSAETFMVGEGIVNSNAIANMLVPGFTGGKRKESRKR